MKVEYPVLNQSLTIAKQQIQSELAPVTSKEDGHYKLRIDPFVPVTVAESLILQNTKLDKSIRILSQDVILNDFTFLTETEGIEEETVTEFWKNNINELYKQIQEFYSYGFGVSEIIFDKNGVPKKLYQIPAKSVFIHEERKQNEFGEMVSSYYAIQQIVGKPDVKMRLSRYNYTEEDDHLPICFWIGGGKTSEFYDVPYWLPAFNSISAKVSLDELNAKKINEGNLLSGILTVIRPPATKMDESIDDTLEEQMSDAGTGIMTLELQSFNTDIPFDVKYIPISEQNYDYLSQLAEKCDDDVLACFSIPKIRMMNASDKESMNSNKSDVIYEVYTKSLENEQMPFEIQINKFNQKYFNFNALCSIETPIFSDKKETEVTTILQLFNNGILTLGETIKGVAKLYPHLNLEYEETNPLYRERYYNGNLLGIEENLTEDSFDKFEDTGDLIEYLKENTTNEN